MSATSGLIYNSDGSEIWVVEYSVEEKQAHIEEFSRALSHNKHNVLEAVNQRASHAKDYLIVAAFPTFEEAQIYCEGMTTSIDAIRESLDATLLGEIH